MAEKDNWDRFEIISKFLGAVVLVAIPIIIKYSADNIAQSLERGKLVQTLIADLSQHSEQAKRDIALVALDAAVQQKESCRILWIWGCKKLEEDAVVDIATILIRDSLSRGSNIDMSQAEAEARTARTIIIRRANEKFYSDTLSNLASKAGL